MFEVNNGLPTPELLLNFVTTHDLAGVTGEQGQQLQGLGPQLDGHAGFAQLFSIEIQLEDAEAKLFLRGAHDPHPHIGEACAAL